MTTLLSGARLHRDAIRVLFVDDNDTQLALYEMVLRLEQFDVLTATRAEAAYNIARTERPHVIVVDIILPDQDGLELCERLRTDRDTASIPLIAITGDETAFSRAKATIGLHAVLKKPCPADDLLTALTSALGAPSHA